LVEHRRYCIDDAGGISGSQAVAVDIDHIEKKDTRLKNVFFDISGVAGPGW
jgi:hypothetical protein